MNSWVDELIKIMEAKQAELERQIAGIKAAIKAVRHGYDLPTIPLPAMFAPLRLPELPTALEDELVEGLGKRAQEARDLE